MLSSRWGWLVGVSCVVGCGQDLALPDGYGQPKESGGGAGPADGVTGVSGLAGASGSGTVSVPKDPVTAARGGSSSAKEGASVGGRPSTNPAMAGEGGAAAGEGGQGGEAHSPPPQLLFSEYVEGKSSDKALEIFALRGGSLDGCELHTFFNGKTAPTKVALEGELASGATHVLCSKELGKTRPCSSLIHLAFNGDDALALVCEGVVQDIIGDIGVDPGESWGMGATLDHTLRRRCEVTKGRTDPASPFDIGAEWLTFDADTFSDLGQRVCDPLTGSMR